MSNIVIRLALGIMKLLPWRMRLNFAARFASHVVAPIAGWRKRIRKNLTFIMPELSPAQIRKLELDVPANIGRSFAEIYSPQEFTQRLKNTALTGPGVELLENAHAQKRPVMLVTGHIGNYDAMRIALLLRGYRVAGLYKPMANKYFNAHYVKAIEAVGKPMFPKSRQGMASMIKFLKNGGMLGVVADQYISQGAPLSFMGQEAMTALSVAELAIKYNALVVPVYGIRRSDLSFELIVSDAIPMGTPQEMTQMMNDDLEIQVRAHPEQWIWMHRRWRPSPPGASSMDAP